MATGALVTQLLAESTEKARDLPVPPAVFGIGALATFGVLLAITWAFRSVGHRH